MRENDKRQAQRVEHVSPVGIKVQSCPGYHDLEGKRFSATTRDASETGLRLLLDQVLPVNTFLEIEVMLGNARFLLSGRVVWSILMDVAVVHTGIIFTEEDESQMWSWKSHLSQLLAGEK